MPGRHDLAPHEETAVTIAFANGPNPVTLSKARARLARGARRFSSAVEGELRVGGMLDETRASGARQLKTLALTLFLGGVILLIPAIALIERQGPWPLVVPFALAIGAVVALIAWAGVVVLSDQAVMRRCTMAGIQRASQADRQQPWRRSADGRASAHAGVRRRARTGSAMVAVSETALVGRSAMVRVDDAGPGGCLCVVRVLRLVGRGERRRQRGRGCRGRRRIRCRLRPDDCRNPPTAALIGNAGDHI